MTYTRRSFLRDTGMVSLAGAMGTTSLLTGCFSPKSFESGVRIFFAGSWIFCGIPNDSQTMLAVAIDPCLTSPCSSDDDVPHIFPYGFWDGSVTDGAAWNLKQYNNQMNQMNLPSSTRDNPHRITVAGWNAPTGGVHQLFCEANQSSRFVYLQKPTPKKMPDARWKNPGLRVIQLPIPTRLIPAAFLEHATLCDPEHTMQPCGHNHDKGVATTHIFEYQGGSSIEFDLHNCLPSEGCAPKAGGPQSVSAPSGTTYTSNLHFHTVPYPELTTDATGKVVIDTTGTYSIVPIDHPKTMFHHMLKFLNEGACEVVGLDGCMMDTMHPGDLVPTSVSAAELQMPEMGSGKYARDWAHSIHLASCDSGGVGSDCPPGGC